MRLIRIQLILAAIGIASVLGLLSLYSGSDTVVTEELPASGGTFTEGIIGRPQQLNPLFPAVTDADRDVRRLVYAGLIRFDERGLPVADLAASWAVSADGLSYSFVLRDDLRWHDNQPITIDDVVFTLQLLQSEGIPITEGLGELWQSVTVKKINQNTLKLTLTEPFAPFLDYMTFAVLPKHIYESGAALGTVTADTMIGAGPFRVRTINRNADDAITDILLTTHPTYQGALPYISQVRLIFFDTEASAITAYQNGQIDALGGVSPTGHAQLAADLNTNLFNSRMSEYSMVLFNQQEETLSFFESRRVRRALGLAINRERILRNVLEGNSFIATGPILPGTWAYDEGLVRMEQDLDEANDLLRAAGWRIPETALPGTADYVRQKDGEDELFEFELLVPDNEMSKAIAAEIINSWGQIGVRATITILPADELIRRRVEPRNFEAALINFSFSETPDPDPYPFWHQTQIEGGQNYSGYSDRRMSEMLEQARITPSIQARKEFYGQFQQRFQAQTPAIMLFHPIYTYAVRDSVQNVQMGTLLQPADRFTTFSRWYAQTRTVEVGN